MKRTAATSEPDSGASLGGAPVTREPIELTMTTRDITY